MIVTKWIFVKDHLTKEQSDEWEKLQLSCKESSASGSLSFAKHAHLLVTTNQFIYAFGYNNEKLLTVLPLMRNNKSALGLSYQYIQTINHDHLDCFIAPGQDKLKADDLISSLIKACRTQLDGWHLFIARRWLFQDSINQKYISPIYKRHAAYLDLNNDQKHHQLIPKKLLKNINRFEKRLSSEGQLNLQISEKKDDLPEALNMFIELEQSGWKGQKGSAIGCQKKLSIFYKNCWSEFSNSQRAKIFLLKIDEQLIAASIGYQASNRLYLHKITYDESLSNNGPGSILIKRVIEYACDDKTLSSLCFNTNPPWVARWHPEFYHLKAVLFFNTNLKGLLLKAFFYINSNLKLLKRHLKSSKS